MSISGKVLLAGLALVLVAGCSGDPAPQAEQTAQDADTDHVWIEQVQTIDRAKEVEQTIKDADEAKREAMKKAGGG